MRAHICVCVYVHLDVYWNKHIQSYIYYQVPEKNIADERQFILNVFENILQEYLLVNIDKTRLY